MAAKARDIGHGRGFELYRWIYAKHKGVGPEQGQAAFRAVTNPAKCRNLLELRDSLDRMFRDIREAESHGEDFRATPSMRVLALEQRLPDSLLAEMHNQMFDSYDKKLAWVQHRVELARQQHLRPPAGGLSRLGRPGGFFDGATTVTPTAPRASGRTRSPPPTHGGRVRG